ncbi:cadherin EGF LAG seven-pass G-type receptor 2-like [Saccoglossus kowalevskii]
MVRKKQNRKGIELESGEYCHLQSPNTTSPGTYLVPDNTIVTFSCLNGLVLTGEEELICLDGNWDHKSPVCEDIDECSDGSSTCKDVEKNEECVNSYGNYECVCKSGYTESGGSCVPVTVDEDIRDECTVDVVDTTRPYCAEEVDEIGYTWPDLPANCTTNWLPCRSGAYGYMRRHCSSDAIWLSADTTDCKSLDVVELWKQIVNVTSVEEANKHVSGVGGILDSTDDGRVLFGGDLLLFNDIVWKVLLNDPLSFDAPMYAKENLKEHFLEIASSLLDAQYEDKWSQIHKNRGVDKGVVPIFEWLDLFARSVNKNLVVPNGKVTATTKNIDLIGNYLWSSGENRNRRSSDNQSTTTDDEPLSVSQWSVKNGNQVVVAVPDELASKNKTNVTTVVALLYHNPGVDYIPVEGEGSGLRSWVKTITAIIKVYKVNSPVLTLSLFDADSGEVLTEVPGVLTFNFSHEQLGYSPKCSYMRYGDDERVWDTDGCSLVETKNVADEDGDAYTICKCDHLSNFAVVMAMGTEPVPFFREAKDVLLTIANVICVLLFLITLTLLMLSSLSQDRYFTLRMTTISFIIFTVTSIVIMQIGDNRDNCRITSYVYNMALVSNSMWLLNLALQQVLRLKYFVVHNLRVRLAYCIIGWVAPIVVIGTGLMVYPTERIKGTECLLISPVSVFSVCESVVIITGLVTFVMLVYVIGWFYKVRITYQDDEAEKLWEDLRCVILLFPAFTFKWVVKVMADQNPEELSYGYLFAGGVLFEGSVIFLSFCAVNEELLVSLRVKFCGSQEYQDAWHEVQKLEVERTRMRKDVHQETYLKIKRIREMRRQRQEEEKKKRDILNDIFTLATHRTKVGAIGE